MFLIVGDTRYTEVSFVNHPADAFARSVEAAFIDSEGGLMPKGMSDAGTLSYSLELFDAEDGKPGEDEDSSKEEQGTKEATIEEALRLIFEDEDGLTEELADLLNQEVERIITDAKLTTKQRKRLKSTTFCGPNRSYPVPDRTHAINALARVKQFGSPALQKRVRACVCRKFPGLPACRKSRRDEEQNWTPALINELESLITHPETGKKVKKGDYIFQVGEDEYTPLTKEQLAALPDSVFIGPARTLPVHDCDHHNAVKQLLERYEGEADTSPLFDRLEEKRLALGCPVLDFGDEPEEREEEESDSMMCLDCLSDEELVAKLFEVEQLLVARGLKAERPCPSCEEKEAELQSARDELSRQEDTVRVLRAEWKDLLFESRMSEESHKETLQELEGVLRSHVRLLLLLTDKDSTREEIESRVAEMPYDDLRKAVEEVDAGEAVAFIRSGMEREPEGTVEPEEAEHDSAVLPGGGVELAETLVKFEKRYGQEFAASYLSQLVRRGRLPAEFTLAKAREVVAKSNTR